jgi:hypothetical protein
MQIDNSDERSANALVEIEAEETFHEAAVNSAGDTRRNTDRSKWPARGHSTYPGMGGFLSGRLVFTQAPHRRDFPLTQRQTVTSKGEKTGK